MKAKPTVIAILALAALVLALALWGVLDGDGSLDYAADVPTSSETLTGSKSEGPTLIGRGAHAVPIERLTQPTTLADVSPVAPRVAAPGRVLGRIVDAEHNPVSPRQVFLERYSNEDSNRPDAAPLSTHAVNVEPGDDGWFWIDDLEEGAYRLRIDADGFLGAASPASPGQAPLTVVLQPGFTLAGRVAEAGGEPVAGLMLTAYPAESPRSKPAGVGRTAEDGGFRIGALAAGEFVLVYGDAMQLEQDAGDQFLPGQVGPIASGSQDQLITVTRGEAISGWVLDAAGNPAPVQTWVMATHPGGPRARITLTALDGSFRIWGLIPGTYDIHVVPSFAAPATDGTSGATTVTGVHTGRDDLAIRMLSGGVIEGIVVDENGDAVPGPGYLYIHPTGTLPGSPSGVVAAPGPDGRFRSKPLPAGGQYDILATAFAGHMQGRAERIEPGAPPITVVVPRALAISGRVVDEKGRPVPAGVGVLARSTSVVTVGQDTRGVAYTVEGGGFKMEGLGPHLFTLMAGGGETAYVGVRPVENVRSGSTDIQLVVKRGISARGIVVDAQDEPLRTVSTLWASAPGQEPSIAWQATVRDGEFVFAGVAPGHVEISAWIDGRIANLGRFDTGEAPWRVRYAGRR